MLNIFKCINCGEELKISADSVVCKSCSKSYKTRNGIVDFSILSDKTQDKIEEVKQTTEAFGWQWHNSDMGHNDGSKIYSRQLFFDRYGICEDELKEYIYNKVVYDPAIGSGRVEHIFAKYAKEIYATDLSDAVFKAKENLSTIFDNINYFKGNLINPPFKENSFDVVVCHAILQHTGNTFEGIKSLTNVLKNGGIIFFDVYRKAAPLRDFTDDFIRSLVSDLKPQEAWDKLIPITKLAQELYNKNIVVKDDIEELEIEAGEYNLQRFIYYKFIKTFWNENMSFEDNHMVVFDWYYPKVSERYTVNEVKDWLSKLDLEVIKLHVLEGGIGVIARKLEK
ncbi:class I SAM-dependent methyltransferase [Arcobacter sp. FWKO B]|uniref:class I SAM-dependent methyltransferase n=1 Tax=Arcobacter sp. FWKO B TaxID=2593672 RepID=UPI0018A68F35|nr:class I SAM-dependent methyltransferase [Arcobacter sp. FWKO B]QOG12156.1 class I SAM-dependent methyltransferase [Arcobacter sp. FWKO B]